MTPPKLGPESLAEVNPEQRNIADIHLFYLHELSRMVDSAYAAVRMSIHPSSRNPYERWVSNSFDAGAIKWYLTCLENYAHAMLRSMDYSRGVDKLRLHLEAINKLELRAESGEDLGADGFKEARDIGLELDTVLRGVGSFSSKQHRGVKARATQPGMARPRRRVGSHGSNDP